MLAVYRRLFDLLNPRERRQFWLLLGMVVMMGVFDLIGVASILPFLAVLANPEIVHENQFLATIYDALGFSETRPFLEFLGIVALCLTVVGQVFKAVTNYVLIRFAKLREAAIGSRLLSGYLRQPYAWFLNRHSADLGKSILSEVDKVIQGVLNPALRILAQSIVVFLLAVLLIIVDPVAAIISALIVSVAYGAVFGVTRRYLLRIGSDRLQANEERYRATQEAFSSIKDVKLLGLEQHYINRFRAPSLRFAQRQAASSALAETPRYLFEAIVFGGMMFLLLALLTMAEGRLESVIPVIGLYAFAGIRLFPAVQILYGGFVALRFNRPALDALHADLANFPPAPTLRLGGITHPIRLEHELALQDVHYTYPGAGRSALQGLSLSIQAQTTVGVVGATGAGKTTAIDVILGLLQLQNGQVLVDGVPLNASNVRAWQRGIGYVPQQIFLTDESVAANIAFGVPQQEIDPEAVEHAARGARIHEFIMRELPKGYQTPVGERGVRLSGGERQRIGIARALYHNPSVLIFDEATSALDNLTEKAVMDAVHNLAGAKTIIIIAHRLSTVRACDEIFLLEAGKCVARGPFDALAVNDSRFYNLSKASGI